MLRRSLSKIAFSLTTLSLAFGAIAVPASASAEVGQAAVVIGSGVLGGLAGLVAGNSKKGDTGASYSVPKGDATLTFTFASTGGGGSSGLRGVVTAPDQTTYETAAIAPGSAATEVITIGPGAPIGSYTISFYQSDALGTTAVGSCVVSNDRGAPPANYVSNLPGTSAAGNQSAAEFVYNTVLIP